MTDELAPTLRSLIEAERAVPAGGDRDAIKRRVLATVGIATTVAGASKATAATTTTTLGVAGKLVAVVLISGAVGGGAALLARDTDRGQPISVHSAPALSMEHVPSSTAFVRRDVSAEAPTSSAATVRDVSAEPPSHKRWVSKVHARRPISVEGHASLLERAWQAHRRGDHAEVLTFVERDATAHPGGVLREEREALRIDSLFQLGRVDEARTHAAAFSQRYPDSLHRALVAPAMEAR